MRQLDMNLQDNEKKSKKRYYEWKYFPLMKPLSAEKPWFSPMIMCSLGFATDTDIRFGYGAEFMISGVIIMYPHPTLKKVKNHHLDALKKLKNKKWNYFSPIHQYESLKSSPRKFEFLNSEFYVHLRYNIKGFIIFDKDIFGYNILWYLHEQKFKHSFLTLLIQCAIVAEILKLDPLEYSQLYCSQYFRFEQCLANWNPFVW